jgi:hypothetical protein
MTLNEFKAWLDGFSSAIDGAPTEKQWEIIMQKLANVTTEVVTQTIRGNPLFRDYQAFTGGNLPPHNYFNRG